MSKQFIDSLKVFYFGEGGAIGAILGSLAGEGIARLLNDQDAVTFLNTPVNAALYFGTIGAFIALAILATQSSYFKHGFRKKCMIYIPNTAPEVCRYKLENGLILCKEKATGLVTKLQLGDEKKIGGIVVTVRAVSVTSERFALHVAGRDIPLKSDTTLTAKVLPGLLTTSPDGLVAEVSRYPKNFRVLGLMNLSNRTWQATLPNGSRRMIDTGRSIKLGHGLKIDFGAAQGEIRSEGD